MIRTAIASVVFLALTIPVALACDPSVCKVTGVGGTSLRVYDGPDGAIVATLDPGTQVEVLERRETGGKVWKRVAHFGADSGYVAGSTLVCDEAGDGTICTGAGSASTPIAVRESPDGKILGNWNSDMRVRPYEKVMREGTLWYAVERFADDNALGWVLDADLECVDEH